jgi:ADP-heptose:LPS heptosyltransferase
VAAHFREHGWAVQALAGPADGASAAALLECLPDLVILRPATLPDLAAALTTAGLYVGNDSGVTHLAGLLGTPTVAVFGASDPGVWRPLGPRVGVAGQKNRWPSVEEVVRTATDVMRS